MITGAAQMDALFWWCLQLMVRCLKLVNISFLLKTLVFHHLFFLNKVDMVDDADMVDMVEEEIRDLLTKYDFPGDKTLLFVVLH